MQGAWQRVFDSRRLRASPLGSAADATDGLAFGPGFADGRERLRARHGQGSSSILAAGRFPHFIRKEPPTPSLSQFRRYKFASQWSRSPRRWLCLPSWDAHRWAGNGAFADDPVAAMLFGVSPARILSATFILAGFSAGLAGWIIAVYYGNVSSSMGTILGLKALLAAIIGGIGRIEGVLIGGILIGLVEATWSAYFDIGLRDIVVFSILIVMFVLRPGGLLGISGPHVRDV